MGKHIVAENLADLARIVTAPNGWLLLLMAGLAIGFSLVSLLTRYHVTIIYANHVREREAMDAAAARQTVHDAAWADASGAAWTAHDTDGGHR